jgi:hypothetical protein
MKRAWFRWPMAPFLRWLGAFPIDQKCPMSRVDPVFSLLGLRQSIFEITFFSTAFVKEIYLSFSIGILNRHTPPLQFLVGNT